MSRRFSAYFSVFGLGVNSSEISIGIVAAEKYFFKATGRRNLFPGFGIVLAEAKQAKKEAITIEE